VASVRCTVKESANPVTGETTVKLLSTRNGTEKSREGVGNVQRYKRGKEHT
jgi:hypothetical protein